MSVTPVVKNGKSCWQVQVIRGATRIRRFLDRKKFLRQDALALEREILNDLDTQQRDGATATTTTPTTSTTPTTTTAPPPTSVVLPEPALVTFADFAERYLALQDPKKSDYTNKVRNVRLHLVPLFGHAPLAAITRQHVDDLRVRLRTPHGERATSRRARCRSDAPLTRRRKGGPKSPKTINNVLATLRAILHLACDYDLILKVPRILFEREAHKDPDFLDFDEAEALIGAAPPEWKLVLRTAIRTGLRRGELLELRWRDVHLEGPSPYLRVSRSTREDRGAGRVIKEPKGRRARSVPLTAALATDLRRMGAQSKPDDLVFAGDKGEHLRFDQLYTVVVAAAKAAGLSKHVHPHLLRHTFASHCYMRRVPPQVVQKWLGHASVTTTERYAHLRPDTDDELIAVLEAGRADPADLGATTGATNRPHNVKTPLRVL
jgi:integrase